MSWPRESRRHSLARRGIRSAQGILSTIGDPEVIPAGTFFYLRDGSLIHVLGEPKKNVYVIVRLPKKKRGSDPVCYVPEHIAPEDIGEYFRKLDVVQMQTFDKRGKSVTVEMN